MNPMRCLPIFNGLICCVFLSACFTNKKISYQKDVQPIFNDKCVHCHSPPYGEGYRETGLVLGSYESLMNGSVYGPVVVPGDSLSSPLSMVVEGRAGNLTRVLKARHQPISNLEIQMLHLWVDQGAKDN
jgi:hypothetical protein